MNFEDQLYFSKTNRSGLWGIAISAKIEMWKSMHCVDDLFSFQLCPWVFHAARLSQIIPVREKVFEQMFSDLGRDLMPPPESIRTATKFWVNLTAWKGGTESIDNWELLLQNKSSAGDNPKMRGLFPPVKHHSLYLERRGGFNPSPFLFSAWLNSNWEGEPWWFVNTKSSHAILTKV